MDLLVKAAAGSNLSVHPLAVKGHVIWQRPAVFSLRSSLRSSWLLKPVIFLLSAEEAPDSVVVGSRGALGNSASVVRGFCSHRDTLSLSLHNFSNKLEHFSISAHLTRCFRPCGTKPDVTGEGRNHHSTWRPGSSAGK